MRVRTSRMILLWLGVIFLGGMLILALAGDAEAKRELPAQVATWGFIGLLFFLGWWFKVKPRRDLHQDQARSLGLRSAPGDPLRYFDRPFALLGHAATAKDIENTSWGSWRGTEVVVIDYWFARSSDPSRSDHRYFTCAATPVPAGWPTLSIVPEGLGSRLTTSMGGRDIEFELESFNRAFEVRSDDPRFAHALIDARMMTWLQELPPDTGFEILDGVLMCRTPRRLDRDMSWALETMATFLAHVPPVVESLFGQSR
ncbi:MAG: hypothetical protein H0W97_10340 [Actinobacteria bacterium]|nr:hypothetical protein [Actinomycetota bacterium]